MIELLRLILGYVEFSAEGGFTERFINLCNSDQISLWNVKNDGVKVVAFTTRKDSERLSLAASKSGMTITIQNKRGLPFWLKVHKKRVGAAVGCGLSVLFIVFMSGLIWNVEVIGDNTVKNKAFTESLEELNVKIGSRKSQIDILDVQEKLKLKHPELLWVSLNIFGGKAQLEYTLATEAPKIINDKSPYNVIAKKNGRVVLVEGYKGTNLIKEGQYVAKGSLLISGVIKYEDSTEKLLHAQGKVFAETDNTEKVKIKKENEVFLTDSVKKTYSINLFSLELPLGKRLKTGIFSQSKLLLIGNKTPLPIGLKRHESISLTKRKIILNEDEREMLGFLEMVKDKRKNYNKTKIEKAKYIFDEEPYETNAFLKILCIEDISEEKPIKIAEN